MTINEIKLLGMQLSEKCSQNARKLPSDPQNTMDFLKWKAIADTLEIAADIGDVTLIRALEEYINNS